MSDLRVLVLDIELAPMTAYIWSLKDQYIGVKQLKTDWYVIAWGAKWLGEPASKIIYRDQRNAKKLEDDKAILRELWDLLNGADVVITQNGERFDGPKLNARFILQGMRPPKPYKHLDTYKLVRKVAAFTSNGLEYLTQKLCTKYRKLSHGRFPGLSLWIECMAGNKKAWAEMKEYNIHDVLSTEELYMKIRAWAPQSMPAVYPGGNPLDHCGTCGSSQVRKEGYCYTRVSKAPQISCKDCGKWTAGKREKLQ